MAAHRLAYCRHISGLALVSLTAIRSTQQLEQPHGTPDCPGRGKSGVTGGVVSLSESRSNIRVAVTLITTLERRPSALMTYRLPDGAAEYFITINVSDTLMRPPTRSRCRTPTTLHLD